MAAIGRVQPGVPATVMTASLLHEVKAFAATAPQSDDITILTLRVH
jgi:serine phosphatase RsbU (regulator of sigma subunit)